MNPRARWGIAIAGLLAVVANAAEIHSNGTGGGPWSEASTWRSKTVPTAADVVTVAGEDIVVVDLKDEQKVSCQELYVDPRGAVSFKRGAGKVVLIVTGPVESYGLLRLDMKDSAEDSGELRVVGPTSAQALIRLQRGGGLVLYGKPGLPDNRRNATLSFRPTTGQAGGRLEAIDNTSLDINHAALMDVTLVGIGLDNTGATPNERMNIIGSRFTGRTRIQCDNCDTPVVEDNEVICEREVDQSSVIRFGGGALGTMRGNKVTGPYSCGIDFDGHTDGSAIGNTVTGAGRGFRAKGPNAMFQQNTARNCGGALVAYDMTGVISDLTAENCLIGVEGADAVFQLSNFRFERAPTNAVAVQLERAQTTLLNCNFTAAQIKHGTQPFQRENRPPPLWWAEAKQYVIARVQGQVPTQAQVAVVTANPEKPLPPGASDPNVHSSPAMIGPGGWTPLPQFLNPLIVRTWRIEADGKVTPTPAYKLRVLGPAPKADTPQPILKEMDLTPQDNWYRPNPNEPKATVEVTVP